MYFFLAATYTVLSFPQLSEEQTAEGACSSADPNTQARRACCERGIYHVTLQVSREVSFQNEAFKAFKTLMKQGKNSTPAKGFGNCQENKGKQKNQNLCFLLTSANEPVLHSLITPHLKTTELFFYWRWKAETMATYGHYQIPSP